MRVNCVGGGPGALTFALALKRRSPSADVTVLERSAAGARQGFGVVLSARLLERLEQEDPEVHAQIVRNLLPWEGIDIRWPDYSVRVPGFALSGMSRETLVRILVARCVELGVQFAFQHEVNGIRHLLSADVVVAADGANSVIRNRYSEEFGTSVTHGANRFAWLGTTRTFDAFTFAFRENAHGRWWVHAYTYGPMASTFIVEGSGDSWSRSGLAVDSEAETTAYFEKLFAEELRGHPLIVDRSIWRAFPTIRNERWAHENIVLLGDAAHTAHFSIGSGMKLAVDGGLELAKALATGSDRGAGFAAYEAAHRPRVERAQSLAARSMAWFERLPTAPAGPPEAFATSLIDRAGGLDAKVLADLRSSLAVQARRSMSTSPSR
jgi:anthraniloyl-CoA monooxygenase